MRDAASSAAPSASTAPAAPIMMPMDVPSGTELNLVLETPVSSETSKPEQEIRARVANPVIISGMTVIQEGAPVTGTVVAAERSGRVKGRASVTVRFNRVTVANTPYAINTAHIVRQAEATKGEDAAKIGIGGKEVTIPAGASLRTTIQETVRITAPMS